jgi:hypothetical protein
MRRRGSLAPPSDSAESSTAAATGRVACPYCASSIAVEDFLPWTGRSQLLSATCQCGRSVTMAAVTLRPSTET